MEVSHKRCSGPTMRITIAAIAKQAGVSTATVDRVINGRAGVRAPIRERILTIARQTGYIDALPSLSFPSRLEVVTLDFVLPTSSRSFMDSFAEYLLEQADQRKNEIRLRIHRFEGIDTNALASCLSQIPRDSRGIGVVALDHPLVREAIRTANAAGTPILTLMSDLSGAATLGYVGINNRAAGRLAAYLLGRFLPRQHREIALFTGSLSYRGHEEREMGFRHLIAEEFDHLEIVEFREIRDDTAKAFEETKSLLAAHRGLAGIYNIGGGLDGIADAVHELGAGRRIVIIGHELTDPIRRHLLNGTIDAVIDQNPRVEAREAIERLRRAALGLPQNGWINPRTQVIFRENIPDV